MSFFHAPDGRRLHYEDTGGPGAPVLCLAGLTRNIADFAHIPALLPDHRVIRLSTRGRGASEHAQDPEAEYQPAVEAGDAIALIDHLGLEHVTLIGTSRGGILGMVMQAMRPGMLDGLILNDVGERVELKGLQRIAGYAGKPVTAETFGEAAEALRRANEAAFPGVPPSRWETHARAVYDADAAGRPCISYDPAIADVVLGGLEGLPPHVDLSPLYVGCRELPTLAIRGENSDILSEHTLAEMAVGRTGYHAVEIPDRGHAPFLDRGCCLGSMGGGK